MLEIGFTNIIARTILAPLERWRIIKQTQIAYPLRPLIFNNIIDYIQSNKFILFNRSTQITRILIILERKHARFMALYDAVNLTNIFL